MSDWQTLENLARRAHEAGVCWSDFIEQHGPAIAAAEPHNIQQFGRLRQRLLHILLTGEASGSTRPATTMQPQGKPMTRPGSPTTRGPRRDYSRESCLAGEKAEGRN